MSVHKAIARLLGTVALALFLAASPYEPTFKPETGLRFEPSLAFAKSGSGNGGSGHDDDDHDDHNDDGHDGGSQKDGGRDDDDDGEGYDGSGRDTGDGTGASSSEKSTRPVRVSEIETSASGVEIRYSDGTKEEIENGRYERKDARNQIVEERPATGADVTRLRSLSNSVSINSVRSPRNEGAEPSKPTKVERQGNNIEVRYSNGWKEEIEAGQYELKDPYNRTVVQRPATSGDVQRLRDITN